MQTSPFQGAPDGAFVSLELQDDATFREIKDMLEIQIRVPASKQTLAFKGEVIPGESFAK